MTGKLYLVTRGDLPPGAQAAQLVHGMATFAREHPSVFHEWESGSNTVVCLAARDERSLHELWSRASDLSASHFIEPDFDDAMTCVVLQPDERARELCKGLPLALR